jgi:hypothetical protein
MFEAFERAFSKDVALSVERPGEQPAGSDGWTDLIRRFGGVSFERGLYRIVRASDRNDWKARIDLAFPEFGGRLSCFGFDWLGRAFALDAHRPEGGLPGVVLLEPGTGDNFEIPCNIYTFHDEELVDDPDPALASDFHHRWLARGGPAPQHDQCVGYKRPLFLGGDDDVGNLEISDIDVYWDLMGQLVRKTKGLPPGTPVHIGRA